MAERMAPPPASAETMVLNVGPQHPSTHGVLRLILELDGETIVRAVPDIGYLHTGIEKNAEKLYYSQVIPLTDRIDYLAPLSNNLVYCLAVEKLLNLEVPPRAQWLRVLLTELTRINNHLVWLGTCALELGAMSVFLYCFREREEILKIFELVSGQRMMTSYFRIGGLAVEPPAEFPRQVDRLLKMLPGHFDEYEDLLTENKIWLARTRGVGVLAPEDAIAYGVSGPTCAPPASRSTCARRSPTPATRSSSSTSPCARKATSTPATWSACRRCARACASPARPSTACPPAPCAPTPPASSSRSATK